MDLEIEGVGSLPRLSMKCKGLTMITGINNVGKSTILKAIYSVLGHASEFDGYKEEQIITMLSDLYKRHCADKRYFNEWPKNQELEEYIDALHNTEIKDEKDIKKLDYAEGLVDGTNDDDFFLKRIFDTPKKFDS